MIGLRNFLFLNLILKELYMGKNKNRYKEKIILSILFIILILILFSFKFQFGFKKNDIIQISSSSRQYVYFEEELYRTWDYEHIDKLYVTDVNGNRFKIEGKYQFFEKDQFGNKVLSETQMVNFEQDNFGRMFFNYPTIYPTLRNVPVFLDKDIVPSERWWAEAEEIVDFSSIGIPNFSIAVPFKVSYQYLGDEGNLAIIKAYYTNVYGFEKDNVYKMNIEYAPKLYTANVEMMLYWDKQLGYVVKFSDIYTIYLVLINGTRWKFTGTTDGSMNVIHKWDDQKKDDLIQKINKDLPKELKDKVEVKKTEKGILLNLGEIFFDFNKYDIKKSEVEKLKIIASILQKYFYGYQVIIEGYTDNVGSEQYNLELSTKRAKTIFDFLVNMNAINSAISYFIGYGESNPIAPNDTEENRAKNRRVQILIVDY